MDITLKDCPLGFYFDKTGKTCLCIESIEVHSGVGCDYNTYEITRNKYQRLLATFEHINTHHPSIILHDQCPYKGTDQNRSRITVISLGVS